MVAKGGLRSVFANRCLYVSSSNSKCPSSASVGIYNLGHRSRGHGQSPEAQLSGSSAGLQLRGNLKCLTPVARVLAEIKGTAAGSSAAVTM